MSKKVECGNNRKKNGCRFLPSFVFHFPRIPSASACLDLINTTQYLRKVHPFYFCYDYSVKCWHILIIFDISASEKNLQPKNIPLCYNIQFVYEYYGTEKRERFCMLSMHSVSGFAHLMAATTTYHAWTLSVLGQCPPPPVALEQSARITPRRHWSTIRTRTSKPIILCRCCQLLES